MAHVFVECGAEFCGEIGLFLFRFSGEADEDQEEGEDGVKFADSERVADKNEQDAGVDRVADEFIGAFADESVTLFDLNFGAPVGAEDEAGPYGEGTAEQGKAGTGPGDPRELGDDSRIEAEQVPIVADEKHSSHDEKYQVAPTFAAGFGVNGALGVEPESEPYQSEREPCDVDPLGGAEGGRIETREVVHGALLLTLAPREKNGSAAEEADCEPENVHHGAEDEKDE